MKTYVNVGRSQEFQLTTALLLYGESSYDGFPYRHPFVTIHDVVHQDGEARLAAGQILTPAMLRTLVQRLSLTPDIEVLPERILARTNDMVAWWTPAAKRRMFFTDHGGDEALRELNGKNYPHPALVFKACGKRLWVRALHRNSRPTADTKLFMAPYWNTYDNAVVCTGTMSIPRKNSVAAISEWEHSFFNSEFSHSAGVKRHTLYPKGTLALWLHLRDKKRFPSQYLCPVKEKLQEFLVSNDGAYRNQHQAA